MLFSNETFHLYFLNAKPRLIAMDVAFRSRFTALTVVTFLINMKYKPHKRQIISWLLTNTTLPRGHCSHQGLEPPFSTT